MELRSDDVGFGCDDPCGETCGQSCRDAGDDGAGAAGAELRDDLSALAALDPAAQAAVLTRLAQEARLVRLARDDSAQAPALSRQIETALGDAMDADEDHQAAAARGRLTVALRAARRAGLRVSASVSAVSVDGVLGTMKMPVLTAYLGADPTRAP